MAPTECLPSACPLACLLACLHACLRACLPACLLFCLLAFLLTCLLTCLGQSDLSGPLLKLSRTPFQCPFEESNTRTHGHMHKIPSSRAPVGAKNVNKQGCEQSCCTRSLVQVKVIKNLLLLGVGVAKFRVSMRCPKSRFPFWIIVFDEHQLIIFKSQGVTVSTASLVLVQVQGGQQGAHLTFCLETHD